MFEITDQEKLRDFFKADGKELTINVNSIPSPALLLHYAQLLSNTLEEYGYQLQCFPICSLVQIIALDVVDCRPLSCLAQLQLARFLDNLSLGDLSAQHLRKAGSIVPLADEMRYVSVLL